ncbi:MAG TPA: hypothetical protein VN651_08140 [Gemmatimonadaceae bacterium]|nr:hypothetical protein [Gemmatimonadaceae bacterium]
MAIHRRQRSLNLTPATSDRLGRALVGSLRSRATTPVRRLDDAVGAASREFRLAGLGDTAVLAALGEMVEDIGRECGADRPSLMTGELRWMPVRARVLESARLALALPDCG